MDCASGVEWAGTAATQAYIVAELLSTSSAPLSPQQLCTEFTKFQHQVETGAQGVETCRQLAESLLEHGHSAAHKAHQRQQDLQ